MPRPMFMGAPLSTTAAVHITPVSGATSLRLKSWLPEHASGAKPVTLAGQALPSKVGAVLSGVARVLCTGPGDWLIVSHEHRAAILREQIEADLPKQGLAVIDLSTALTVFEVGGPASRELLSKGCGLDLHPRSFPAGRCARTRFAQLPLVIECLDEWTRFAFHVQRSYSRYLHDWLTDAAIEWSDALP